MTKVQQIIHRLPKSLHMGDLRPEVQTPNECQVPATPVSDTISVLDVVTGSPEETEALAARLAARLRAGDVVAVSGELGAGKTTFVRGAARALGVQEPVSSPTFTIGHRYESGRSTEGTGCPRRARPLRSTTSTSRTGR